MNSGTTFGKQNRISISKSLAAFLVFLFIVCLAATGLLVYHFSSCAGHFQRVERLLCENNRTLTPETALAGEDEASLTTDVVATTSSSTDEASGEPRQEPRPDLRLPKNVVPHSYEIKLVPFVFEGNFTFHGRVSILVNVTEQTDVVYLHALDLTFDRASWSVWDASNNTVEVLDVAEDLERQFVVLKLEYLLETDQQYYVSVSYKGVLNDLLQGFYRSSYKDGNVTRWIAATQFQPTDARRAFPCFDEPALRARFSLSLARWRNMSTISNMPQVGSPEPVEGLEGYVWDHYEETVPMSTYLLAFVVSDFERISNGTFSVWARKSAISQSKFGLQVGQQILRYYEKFFNIKYPLPKIDMIALPDFAAGAMENWGLLTYRESVILYEPEVSSRRNSQRIAMVIAHELAHQWFGNLVTPVWWTDLWLNEGFATYVEYIGANIVSPDWKVPDQFVINELQSTFQMDALRSSHPISVVVNDPDEVNDIFDKISYSKGAAIIRMMEFFLSTKIFRIGIYNYLNERKYGNAEQDDLWATLTEIAHAHDALDKSLTVKEIMDTWTLQVGFPVVTLRRNYQNGSLLLTQERFFSEQSTTQKPDQTLWWIPVTYTDIRGRIRAIWMRPERRRTVQSVSVGYNEWLLANVNQTGYYRVNYDRRNWKLLTEQLRRKGGHLKFDQKNRAQLLDDALNLAATGYISYDVALNITTYLVQERDYIPWAAAFANLDHLYAMFVRTGHFDKFKAYILYLIDGLYKDIGFNDSKADPQLVVYTRITVVSRACLLGVLDCIVNAVRQFQNWSHSPDPDKHNPISPNLRGIVYCTAIANGGQEEWDFAWKRYQATNVGTEKELLLSAMSCSRETWILSRYLEWAITDGSGIRKQDSARVFAAVATNVIGRDLAYRFFKNNWERLRNYVGSSSMILSQITRSCTSLINTRDEVDDLRRFSDSKSDLGVAMRAIQQSIEHGEANVQWMDKNYEQIVRWLSYV